MLAILAAEETGKTLVHRVGPSFVRARTGQDAPPPIEDDTLAALVRPDAHGLVVVGSHVGLTTRQLARLGERRHFAHVELDVPAILDDPEVHIRDAVGRAVEALGIDLVVLSTSRALVTGADEAESLDIARRLLAAPVALGGAAPVEVGELILADLVPPGEELAADPRVRPLVGELGDALPELGAVDTIFHLAGVVSGAAEAGFDLGMRTNLDGTRALLVYARGLATPPVLVFSGSLAVFGNDPALSPLDVVDDDTLPRPQSSYGIQKFIGEQLVADYTRKGFVRGRSVRLMTVSVRPGKPNAAASSFLSGIIREPLAGERAVCPSPPTRPSRCPHPGARSTAWCAPPKWTTPPGAAAPP
ncbi:NAD-dependent epimerase/dehydratase family protein [Amycolatopsis methanolica]|uniref:NAD-dependent epimerase/dehydratase family protein n=1 Tax=Amycolatopsis methanolica TaxID=1814 RepID=UPI0034468ED3